MIFVLTSLISLSNFITLDRKRNLQKPAEFRPCHFRFGDLFERSKNLPKCLSLIVTFYTVEALVSGHPRDGIKMSVTGAGRLREWF